MLGSLYSEGAGVLKDEIEGLAWYYLARSNVEDKFSPQDISSAEDRLGRNGALAAQQRAREIARKLSALSSDTQANLQGFSPKLTKGEISSLAGMRYDPRHWQISAPIQPGNSGGPLFDENGDIIGIIVSKLDEIAVAERTGNLTQNVNYALKSAYIRPLLEEHDIPTANPKDAQGARLEDVAERVQKSVVMVISYGER
jgi:hypothetical protein